MIRTLLLNIFFYIPVWLLRLVYLKRRTPIRGHMFDFQSFVLLDLMPKKDLTEVSDDSIQSTRDLIDKKRTQYRLSLKASSAVTTIDHNICSKNNLALREYIPVELHSKKAVLYFHGGGYVISSIKTHDMMVSFMSDKIKAKFFSLEYRLSPENKYPAALDDALKAYNWLISKGYCTDNISLCGDSAGAHLASSLVHYLALNNIEMPHSQFLIYPMCDPHCSTESYDLMSDGYLLTKKNMLWFWEKFGNNKSEFSDPLFNLLKIDIEKKLPITVIVTAGFDPLSDEAEEYAYLLHKKGDNVKQLHYPKMFHGFASMTRLKSAKLATEDFLREYKEML